MKNLGLKILFLGMSIAMIVLVIVTSMQSDMFNLDPIVTGEPWFRTTLVDFYFNIVIISSWMFYKESSWLKRIIWLIAFITLGSIATCGYVFLQLISLKSGEGFDKVLLKREEA